MDEKNVVKNQLPINSKGNKLSTDEIKNVLILLNGDVVEFDPSITEEYKNKIISLFSNQKNWSRIHKSKGYWELKDAIVRTFMLKNIPEFRLFVYSTIEDSAIVGMDFIWQEVNNKTHFKLFSEYSAMKELSEQELNDRLSKEYEGDSLTDIKNSVEYLDGDIYIYCMEPSWGEDEPYMLESYLYVGKDDVLEVYRNEGGYAIFTDDSNIYLLVKNKNNDIIGRYIINDEPFQFDGEFNGDAAYKATIKEIKAKYGFDVSKGYCVSHM